MKSVAVSVSATATVLLDGANTSIPQRRSGTVVNTSSTTVYLGGSDVTTANGTPCDTALIPSFGFDLEPGEKLYGIVASGTQEVRILRNGE